MKRVIQPNTPSEARRRKRRLLRLVVIGVLFVAAGLAYRHFWFARPVGDGAAGPPVPAEPFQHVWTERPMLLLGVGDSITAGLGASRNELTYFNRLIRRCAEESENVHLVPVHVTFLGHGSHCTQFWREHYRPEDPHYWYYDNIEDPNDRGYDTLRRIFLLKIMEVLGPSLTP